MATELGLFELAGADPPRRFSLFGGYVAAATGFPV